MAFDATTAIHDIRRPPERRPLRLSDLAPAAPPAATAKPAARTFVDLETLPPSCPHDATAVEARNYWRERALRSEEALQAHLRPPGWDTRLKPFTLYETRVLRLLAQHGRISVDLLQLALYGLEADDVPDARTLRSFVCRARAKLPPSTKIEITAEYRTGWKVMNADGLAAYLDSLEACNKPPRRQRG